jgi:hypothetical protein
MTKQILPDEKHIQRVVDNMDEFIKALQHTKSILENKEADMFSRFMSYIKFDALMDAVRITNDVLKFSVLSGHALAHPELHTAEAKEKGWNQMTPWKHPFFINEGTNVVEDLLDFLIKRKQESEKQNESD